MTEYKFPDMLYANNIYKCKSKVDLVTYYQQKFWSPIKSTWIQSIKSGVFITWPGLTAELVQKYLPKSEATMNLDNKQDRIKYS